MSHDDADSMTDKTDAPLSSEGSTAGRDGTWQGYTSLWSVEEDIERTNTHYDLPAEFFVTFTGGRWHNYSCNLWDGATTETESQERKLDLLAELMQLRPGQRVLDVGSGWGGSLVYLTKRYGVRGIGISLSPSQCAYAKERAEREQVEVDFRVCHWRDFEGAEPFDVVYSDEVVCHFKDLGAYFAKVKSLLKPGGRMLNKELHLTSSKYFRKTKAGSFLTGLLAGTGEYRVLHDELAILDRAGFALEQVLQIPAVNFQKTMEAWFNNLQAARTRLEELVGAEEYRRYSIYLRFARRAFADPIVSVDIVLAKPIEGYEGAEG
jgi:cyclopropane-fatty-acyl-phospholipid synthase